MPIFNHHILNHRNIYLLGLACILISLPLSHFGISLGTFIVGVNWLLEGTFLNKWKRIKENKGLIIFVSIYLLWIIGLWNTQHFGYAFHDLKIKLPILVIPLILGSSEKLNNKELRFLSISLLLGLWVSVTLGLLKKTGIWLTPLTDNREMGVFISHIRLALITGTGIFLALEHLKEKQNARISVFLLLSIIYLAFFLFILKTFTAIFVLASLIIIICGYHLVRMKRSMLQYFLSILALTLVLLSIDWIVKSNNRFYTVEPFIPSELDSLTINGNPYKHYINQNEWENGHYTWLYVCEKELRREWNKMSSYDYDGKDRKGNEIRFTLIRYLTSRGLRKDSLGVHKLSPHDIAAIESGIANILYSRPYSLYGLYYKWLWELNSYRNSGDPTGHSLVLRLAFQKTGWHIAQKHLLAGVGTGDVQDVFDQYYESSHSPIAKEWQLRAHNQYLTTLITLGIPGFFWFVFAFFYPWIRTKNFTLTTLGFIFLAAISMLWEDTLETQVGVYFIVFFYAFLIFARGKENKTVETT